MISSPTVHKTALIFSNAARNRFYRYVPTLIVLWLTNNKQLNCRYVIASMKLHRLYYASLLFAFLSGVNSSACHVLAFDTVDYITYFVLQRVEWIWADPEREFKQHLEQRGPARRRWNSALYFTSVKRMLSLVHAIKAVLWIQKNYSGSGSH